MDEIHQVGPEVRIVEASRDKTELITADLDLDKIREVRNVWQFYRDRRPETYGGLVKLLGAQRRFCDSLFALHRRTIRRLDSQ